MIGPVGLCKRFMGGAGLDADGFAFQAGDVRQQRAAFARHQLRRAAVVAVGEIHFLFTFIGNIERGDNGIELMRVEGGDHALKRLLHENAFGF